MPAVFHLVEIVKFAIEKEKESYDLYQHLANIAETKEAKQLFTFLASEEKKHEDFYIKMLKGIQDHAAWSNEQMEDYKAYVQDLIATSRTLTPILLNEVGDVKSAIDYAILREKESILFYVGLKNFLPAIDNKHLDLIIQEEAKHAAMLTNLKKKS